MPMFLQIAYFHKPIHLTPVLVKSFVPRVRRNDIVPFVI
jgi:hypothetical protein